MQTLIEPVKSGDVNEIDDGEQCTINGKPCVFYAGYWIRRYDITLDAYGSFADKKRLIKMLTRRVFHNTETGINMPGYKLDETRAAFENNNDPDQKRINAAMLAGALLNRATDILAHVVELQKDGVVITPENDLISQCGKNLMEALELGKQVKHYSGEEGIDELWGEPFKAFSQPINDFYKSRYQKIGLSMAMIDHISTVIKHDLGQINGYMKLEVRINKFANAAKLAVETVKEDPVFLELWPVYVAAAEELLNFRPVLADDLNPLQKLYFEKTNELIKTGKDLISYISSARVPMPNSCNVYTDKCQLHADEMRKVFVT